MIKEVKKILKSTYDSVGRWRADEFRTFLVRAEAILNNRPIAFGDDGEIISPRHFLQPSAEVALGPPLGAPNFQSLIKVKKAEQIFWEKFVKFYLPTIAAERVLGEVRNDVLLPGDRVLLKEGSNPLVDKWTPATIVETYPSGDGVIRTALVDSEGGKTVKDVSRICILEGPVLERRKGLPPPSGGVSSLGLTTPGFPRDLRGNCGRS
jgi:hypothetical protein